MSSEYTVPVRVPGRTVSISGEDLSMVGIRRHREMERQRIIPNAIKEISGIKGLEGSEDVIQHLIETIRSKMLHEDPNSITPDWELAVTYVKDALIELSKAYHPVDPDTILQLLRRFADVAILTESLESLRYITALTKTYGYESKYIIANVMDFATTTYNGLSFSRERQNDLIQDTVMAISKAGNATEAEELSQEFLKLARQTLLMSHLRVPDHDHQDFLFRC
jgi:hypothetical protein